MKNPHNKHFYLGLITGNGTQSPKSNDVSTSALLQIYCIYTLRPRSSAYGSAKRSPTADTDALFSSNDLAA